MFHRKWTSSFQVVAVGRFVRQSRNTAPGNSNRYSSIMVGVMEIILLRDVIFHDSVSLSKLFPVCFCGWCMHTNQVQDSANYFSQAQDKLKEIKSSKPTGPIQIKAAFEELAKCLRSAEEVLVLPPAISAHHIYTSEQKVGSQTVNHHSSYMCTTTPLLIYTSRASSNRTFQKTWPFIFTSVQRCSSSQS